MNEPDGKALAVFRVYRPGGLMYYARRMSEEEKSIRRMYLRKELLTHPAWANLPNSNLDDIRLFDAGTGQMLEDESGYIYLLLSPRSRAEKEFRKVRAMMPFEFMELTAKDFKWNKYKADVTKPKDMVNKYILNYMRFKDNGMGLYIHSGTKGSGKTMLSCCLVNEINNRYAGVSKFVNILDFLEMTKKGFNGNDDDIKALYQANLLVLDDIGVQMSKEWIDTVLYRLINERYINRLPTIYTSNVPVDRLKMDDRITDRIESTTYPVSLPEESIRKETRKQDKQKLLDEIKNAPSDTANIRQGNEQPEPSPNTK